MANELSGLLEVAGEAVDRLAVTPAESLHRAVAGRVFRAVGPLGTPTRVVHDGVSRAAYRSVRGALGAGFKAASGAIRVASGGRDVRPLSRSRRGRLAVAAINGVLGDELAGRANDLAITMSVRSGGRDVASTPAALRQAFPAAGPRLGLFLHGLAETEELWRQEELGLTAVYVRYNSGLHVSVNGARLAQLLEELVGAWPVTVRELALVGHSMGGLVARSACLSGTEAGHRWPALVRHLVTLGTPHTGAPLEKATHALAWALRKVPEAAPLAAILDSRSAGIRDLRFGYLLDAEWAAEDPARLFDDRRSEVPLLAGCTHTFITATVTRDPRHPLGRLLGDLLVRSDSAGGRHRSRAIPLPAGSVLELGPLHHFNLLDHELVYDQLRRLLGPA